MTIHNNPELCYEEFVAHETLTAFLKSKAGWTVSQSAYGIATAFAAEYDTGKPGPVVSFNVEYGTYTMRIVTIR
jgi:metal-dependent amidase/aminoacylase/carboxypeptidase family protein